MAIAINITEWVEQQICIKVCVKLEHSSMEIIWIIWEASAIGNWWLTASAQQHACSCIASLTGFCQNIESHKTSNHTRSATLRLLGFPKTKITSEKEGISDGQWDSGKYNGAADGHRENYVRSQGAYIEEDQGIIVLCTMFLVSSPINVSIFHITWLDTSLTDNTHTHKHTQLLEGWDTIISDSCKVSSATLLRNKCWPIWILSIVHPLGVDDNGPC